MDGQEIEVTCHIAPKALLRETNFVFPFLAGGARTAAVAGIESYDTDSCKSWVHGELLILPTCQERRRFCEPAGQRIGGEPAEKRCEDIFSRRRARCWLFV